MSYERAVSMHTAAREMVYVAEQGLMADGKNTLDPTWQEMLNHATSKVTKRRRDTCSLAMVFPYQTWVEWVVYRYRMVLVSKGG